MKPTLVLLLSTALLSSGCLLISPDEPGPPPPDDCSSPRALDGIDAIEIGTLDQVDGQEVFVPWEDDAVVDITRGLQGGYMLGAALGLRGSDVPACVEHRMELYEENAFLTSTRYPVRTYEQPDGTRITRTIWLIFDGERPWPGDVLDLALHMGTTEMHRRLLVEVARPERVRIIGGTPLQAGATHDLELTFDREILAPVRVSITSSDPEVVYAVDPTLRLDGVNDAGVYLTEIRAAAPGSAVLSVSANGRTIETEVTVE